MTADQKRWKTLLIGMALIIGFSGVFHIYLVRKKALRTHRYTPQYAGTPAASEDSGLDQDGAMEGEVVAVSYDKFFLRDGKRVQQFSVGTLRMPRVGDRISIAYTAGKPPTASQLLTP